MCLFGGAGSIKHYQELGRLVAQAGTLPWEGLVTTYGTQLMQGLALLGTRGKHVNVLQHLMGYLKRDLSPDDKQELLALVEDHRQELVPLIVPQMLPMHHLRRHAVPPAPGGDRREGQGEWVCDARDGRI